MNDRHMNLEFLSEEYSWGNGIKYNIEDFQNLHPNETSLKESSKDSDRGTWTKIMDWPDHVT